MGRLPNLQFDKLTKQQRRIYDEIASHHPSVRGLWAIWLTVPEIADVAHKFYLLLRVPGKLEPRLVVLLVLVMARHWSSQFEWFLHEGQAHKVGISADVIEAIRAQRRPVFAREDERLVYDVVTEINDSRTLCTASYERAAAALGNELLVELITTAGFYAMVSMMLNVFDAEIPGGNKPLP
jgi:4-carboxymuconolactone decarboxylase